ncbi:MAG: UDP-N-acetylmuramoyl-tripeptide--D-alanyl-D-alanine ligase [Clostridia bacterium]|nr:UDP-N-acetylmuramoyl-tripeptide--D-alanyl-D-alanine ligase [Clostridia bacterium]
MIDFFDFSSGHFYVAVILSFLNAMLLCFEGYKFMQIIQLNGYHLTGYFDWLKNTREKYFGRIIMLVLLSCAGIVVTNVIFRIFATPLQYYLSYLGLIFYFLFSGIYLKVLYDSPKKIPLKMTARMRRSMGVFFVLSVFLTFALLLLSSLFTQIFRYGAVALMPLLLPLLAPFSHFLMIPIEKKISKNYIKKAEKKLSQFPNLIRIGITGSYGKTTIKNALKVILSEKYSVCITPQNYNTPMGITKTVLNDLKLTHQIFIAEMGARKVGDIKELCEIVKPTYGIIGTIGEQHMATFGSFENVKRTKAELADFLGKDGFCVFNGDNEKSLEIAERFVGERSVVAIENKFKIYAKNIKTSTKGTDFEICVGDNAIKCNTKLLGEHNIINILLCVPMALKLGLNLKEIANGISKISPVEHRLQLVNAPNNVIILDDTYNASIEGSRRALEVLSMFNDRRKIVITPGLVELGTMERLANYEFGERISEIADIVIIVNHTNEIALKQGLIDKEFDEEKIYNAENTIKAQEILTKIIKQNDVILWENDLPDSYI